ncbi:hypothetical protein B0H14DRAFT_3589438 [Mycena olivaceomarginata]|nr:hypothetical protein B0H14DRAFT_3589438 [Mycena olivaceomarginata]
MAPRAGRPKPRALDDSAPADRKAKLDATRNAIWVGAAPTGSKIKSDSGVRKRAASTTKESTRSKTTKKNHPSNEEDVPMEEPEPEEMVLSSRGSKARRMIIDSPTASETEAISTQTKTTVNRASSKARPGAPKSQSAIEDAFDEDEAVDSDGGGDPGDDDNEYLDDGDDDLKELGPGELQQQLADEVPQWTNGDDEEHEEQDEDDCVFSDDGYRASSRASFSSGHHSVPESHIEISDSDSEPDSALRAGLSGLRTAHRRVADAAVIEKFQPPSNPKQTRKAVSEGPLRSEVDARTSDKPRGKRELQREEQELPSWNPERPLVRANSRKPSRATKVKVEPEDKHSLSRSHIRKPSTTAAKVKVKTEPVERLEDPDTDSIEIRLNERGAVGTKTQHRDVERMLQLAIDYYFGFHIIENMYPDLRGKTKFGYDSMARATRDLTLAAIANKLRDEEPYREGLVPVRISRESQNLGNSGSVQKLRAGQTFIYPRKPGRMDFQTNKMVPGEPDRKKPYQHDGVIAVAAGFFTGQAPIAERVEAMFVRNEAGNYEATPPMVAISCAALSDAMNDLSTGEHKFAKFEGSRVQDIYDVHIQLLATLKQTKPARYHSTMEMIFTKAS